MGKIYVSPDFETEDILARDIMMSSDGNGNENTELEEGY